MDTHSIFSFYAMAALLGIGHTLLGPDHYVPLIALSRARGWTCRRTFAVTLACGPAHVLSSVLIGAAGLAFGFKVLQLEKLEAVRGGIAGWTLLAAGLLYFLWGLRQAFRSQGPEKDMGRKADGIIGWLLFLFFVFGPCDPLIPVLLFPAAAHGPWAAVVPVLIFSLSTLAAMSACVAAGLYGMSWIKIPQPVRYGHALAGAALTVCGIAVSFAGF